MKKKKQFKKSKNKYLFIVLSAVVCAILISILTINNESEVKSKEIGFNQIQTLNNSNEQIDILIKNLDETRVLSGEDHDDYSEIGKFIIIDFEIINQGDNYVDISNIEFKLRDENLSYYDISGEIYHLNETIQKDQILEIRKKFVGQTLFEVPNSSTIFKLEVKNNIIEENKTLIFNLN